MVRVDIVFNALKSLANKDQKGFVTPAVFNKLAPIAQLKIYNRLFDQLKNAHRNTRPGFDPARDKSLFKRIHEDLSVFTKSVVIIKEDGVFAKPDDFSRAISATTNGTIILNQSTRVPLEMCYDRDKLDRILRSRISKPRDTSPVLFMLEDIEVYPQSINRIRLNYYKIPQSLDYEGNRSPGAPAVAITGGPTFSFVDTFNSYNFELPEHYTQDIIAEMAEMIGLNLRDKTLSDYSTMDQNQTAMEQTFS
jgi:hypothetical protein